MKAIAKAPNPRPWIDPKKEYKVEDFYNNGFYINNDGNELYCLRYGCAHLAGGDWTLIPETPEEEALLNGQ